MGGALIDRPLVLVIEDEPSLAALLERVLEREGLQSRIGHSGAAGWELFAGNPLAFKLALIDLSLPDGRGEIWIRRIHAANPSLPVIAMSGLPPRGLPESENVHFLPKPFGLRRLQELVVRLIGRAAHPREPGPPPAAGSTRSVP